MARRLFTNRLGGVSKPPFESFNLALHVGDDQSAVAENRTRLAALVGVSPDRLFFMNQVHGRDVAIIDELSDANIAPSVDALFTKVPGLALVTLIADCVPVLLYSEGAIAAVHIGRKGLVAGVLDSALEQFHRNGITNSEIFAELGPSICGGCYEVDIESYYEVVESHPAAATTEAQRCVDVAAGIRAQLKRYEIGVKQSPLCVMHDPGYFSYRRDGVTGRQAGVVLL